MSGDDQEEKVILPHHKQLELCTTRLPYRQGRKLTAIKAYTINNESNHLLIFGVPTLNLRQESKALFAKFGKLDQYHVTTDHPAEPFTETYHAMYDRIQSARIAKRMLDTKTFYGSSLHVCYAPEFETIEETRMKLYQRQKDVIYRLNNLQKDDGKEKVLEINEDNNVNVNNSKLNMGEINTISIGKQMRDVVRSKHKRKDLNTGVIEKRFKPCFIDEDKSKCDNIKNSNNINSDQIEIIDCTSTEKETISDLNELLNYNNFGNEVIRKVQEKPINKITFKFANKSKLL